jgi:hypothetical protein
LIHEIENATSHHPSPTRIFAGVGAAAFIADVQAILGLILVTFLTFCVAIGGLVLILDMTLYWRPQPATALLVAGWIAWTAIAAVQWKCLQFIGSTLEEVPEPRPVYIALRQRINNPVARAIFGLWWMANAVAVIVIARGFIPRSDNFRGAAIPASIIMHGFSLCMLTASAWASNSLFLCAAACLRKSEQWLLKIWRCSLLIDVVVAIAAWAYSLVLPHFGF